MIGVLPPSKKDKTWNMSTINNITKHNLSHTHSYMINHLQTVLTHVRFINHSKTNHHIINISIHWKIQNTPLKYGYTVSMLIHPDFFA